MKLHETQATIETSGLENKTHKFSVQESGKMFQILSSGIYSNKIAAVVRELACNAYDAHVMLGKQNVPFEIHVPSYKEAWFAVRDFGPGLNYDDVVTLFTTYGESTKTNCNSSIGAFGLGSKSPFAYTTAFMITSIHQGIKRIFNAFIAEDGVPKITMISEHNSQEESGIEIKVPVASEFNQFADECKKYLSYFNPRPILHNQEAHIHFKLDDRIPTFSGKNWRYYTINTYDSPRCTVVQGHVPYEIKKTDVPAGIEHAALEMIDKVMLEIDFDIGDLDIAVSRESLSYDKQTITNLNEKLLVVRKELHSALTKYKMDLPGTGWENAIALKEFKEKNSQLFYLLNEDANNEFKLHLSEAYPTARISTKATRAKRLTSEFGSGAHNWYKVHASRDVVFYIQDIKRPLAWYQHTLSQQGKNWDYVYLHIINPGEHNVEKILNDLGNPPYALSSTLQKPPRQDTIPKAPVKTQFSCIVLGTEQLALHMENRKIEKNSTIYVVEKRRGRMVYKDKKDVAFRRIIDKAQEIPGWIDDNIDVVFILTNGERAKLHPSIKVVDFGDYISEKFTSWCQQNKSILIQTQASQSVRFDNGFRAHLNEIKRHEKFSAIEKTSLGKLVNLFLECKEASIPDAISSIAHELGLNYGVTVNAPENPLNILRSQVYAEYPLLNHVEYRYNTSVVDDTIEYVLMRNILNKPGKTVKVAV